MFNLNGSQRARQLGRTPQYHQNHATSALATEKGRLKNQEKHSYEKKGGPQPAKTFAVRYTPAQPKKKKKRAGGPKTAKTANQTAPRRRKMVLEENKGGVFSVAGKKRSASNRDTSGGGRGNMEVHHRSNWYKLAPKRGIERDLAKPKL